MPGLVPALRAKSKKFTLENDNVAYVESVFMLKHAAVEPKNGQKMHPVTSILPFFCFIQLWSHIFVSKNGPVAYVGNCFFCCKMAKNASFWVDFFIFSCIVCDCVSIFSKSTCQRWKFIMKQLLF